LRAEFDEAIRMEPAPARRHAARDPQANDPQPNDPQPNDPQPNDPQPKLDESLRTWAAMIRHRRALVIARRHLIAGLGLAIAAELVVLILGGDRLAWWLLAPVALAPIDAAIAVRRPVRAESVAHMLDRSLDLRDLLATAVSIPHEERQPPGLAGLVLREANAASAGSFAAVRLKATRRRREWALLASALTVLVVLAATPGIGVHESARHTAAAARAGTAARARTGAKPTKAPPAGRRVRAPAASVSHLARPPLAVTTSESRQTKGSGFSPYGHGAASLSAKQLAREGIAPAPATTKSLGALAIGESGGGSAASSANAPAAGTGTAGDKGTPNGAATSTAARGTSSAAGASALAQAGSHSASSAAGAGGTKQGGVGAGGASTGSSPPGGNAAGTAAASNTLGNGLTPELGAGLSGLPLQAGYAPSSTPRSPSGEGVSQTPNGGGSGGRSAHTNSGSGTSVSSSLGVIPPTFNTTPTLDQGVLSSYFGSANQLTPGDW
jgi:hypothetical protein